MFPRPTSFFLLSHLSSASMALSLVSRAARGSLAATPRILSAQVIFLFLSFPFSRGSYSKVLSLSLQFHATAGVMKAPDAGESILLQGDEKKVFKNPELKHLQGGWGSFSFFPFLFPVD